MLGVICAFNSNVMTVFFHSAFIEAQPTLTHTLQWHVGNVAAIHM